MWYNYYRSTNNAEQLADTLDKGLNILPLLPDDHVVGIEAYHNSGSSMLTMLQSPYLHDHRTARLTILGVLGSKSYVDEGKFAMALSNHVSLPDGTHAQLKELAPQKPGSKDYHLSEEAIAAAYAIGGFLRAVHGNVSSARINFDTDKTAVQAEVSGVFTTDEMRTDYLDSVGRGVIVDEHSEPTRSRAVAHIAHTVLTPTTGQVINFAMHDHRPGKRDEMLRLQGE